MEQFTAGLGSVGLGQKGTLFEVPVGDMHPKICRLCLSEILGACTFLEGVIRDMLEIILPELKLGICDSPAICNTCLETLKQSYNFKSSCLEAEDKVQGFMNPKSPTLIDLNLVVSTNRKRIPINIGPLQSICRTCLNITASSSCTKLYSSEGDPLKNMIDKCLPEMGVELTKEPVICQLCLEMLEEQFHFIMQCLDCEEKINYYCEKKNCHNKIDLHSVYLYSMCIDDEGMDHLEKDGGLIDIDSVQSSSQHNQIGITRNIIKSTKPNRLQIKTVIKNSTRLPIVQDLTEEDDDNISETISITSIGDVFEMSVSSSKKEKSLDDKAENLQEKRPLQGKLVRKSMLSPRKDELKEESGTVKKEETKPPPKMESKFKEIKHEEEEKEDEEEEETISEEDFEDFAYRPTGPNTKRPKKCRHCDFKTNSLRSFKSHMVRKHPGKRITRSDFARRSSSTSASETNTEPGGHEKDTVKSFKCDKCNKKFETLRSCKMHTTVMHTKLENKKSAEMANHTTTNHDKSNVDMSSPSFTLSNNSENGIAATPIRCNIGKTPANNIKRPFPFKDGNLHKKSPPVITKPQYSTKQTYRFDRHMLTMYKCRLCPYQTRLKSNFTKHQLTHKKMNTSDIIKVHKCDVASCTFETVQKESLITHMKSHDVEPEEQLRKCFLCSFTTKKIEHLRKHVKDIHKAGSG